MATNSKIEWTECTWNPVTGCAKISPGCKNCYAERMAKRLKAMGQVKYRNGSQLTTHPDELGTPLDWRKPKTVFVCSMSDLFHEEVPDWFILQVFIVMCLAKQHRFQVLTKRLDQCLRLNRQLPFPRNIWLGASVENANYTSRIDNLRETGAQTKFLSLEPLLGPTPNLNLKGIDWVIVGGESGQGARSMAPEWALDIRDQCVDAGVPFFFKQWGKIRNNPDPGDRTAKKNGGKAKGGRMLDGRIWDEMPRSVG